MITFKHFIKESIAVDLDATLAHYTSYKKGVIGKPIPAMLENVKKWIEEGKTVKIFTARANDKKDVKAIKEWLKENNLPDLEITNIKTPDMEVFYDDKAIQIKKNKGIPVIDKKDKIRENLFYDTYSNIIEEDWKSSLRKGAAIAGLGASALTPYSLFHPKQQKLSPEQIEHIKNKVAQDFEKKDEEEKRKQETEDFYRKIEQRNTPQHNIKNVPRHHGLYPTSKEKNLKQLKKLDSTLESKIKTLIPAIAKKETGHLKNPNNAIGDKGVAFGKYQIHPEVVKDVNTIYGTSYKHHEMFNPQKAVDVLVKYLSYWGKHFKQKHGRPPTHRELAAIWNGGPQGTNKQNAIIYAQDVIRFLAKN
jgi:hypothetical protein